GSSGEERSHGQRKPRPMTNRRHREQPTLPQINQLQEVQDALGQSLDIYAGYRHVDDLPAKYAVDGILLPRPFKITRIGPVSLFVDDVDKAQEFYTEELGFVFTEETFVRGRRCAFLRTH